jgi:hypothetical protein
MFVDDSFYIDEFYPINDLKHPRVQQGFDPNNRDSNEINPGEDNQGDFDPFADFAGDDFDDDFDPNRN